VDLSGSSGATIGKTRSVHTVLLHFRSLGKQVDEASTRVGSNRGCNRGIGASATLLFCFDNPESTASGTENDPRILLDP